MATQESTLHLKKNNEASTSNATVTVASKAPFDIILKLYDLNEMSEPVMGGGYRTFKQYQERLTAKPIVIQGNSWAQNQGPHQQIVGGFAITHDVPKAFWDEWYEQNKNSDYIKNEMIFAHTEARSVTSKATDMAEVKSNIERLDPKNLPRDVQESERMNRPS
ncbi:hypothetical protein BLA17378_04502 [Burkholderia aenigmatica]|uniref:Uncharacterized protein n=1 Tax=Burkholderia aenigmatica TaxID=2015348 RepID=A0ABY6Y1D0_9BURK|nr:hypothetical protein [Burkholderia aenigmatica]VWC89966.1 hypothetical protein BLA17378_04502 [Burkholderia aenigmatica]